MDMTALFAFLERGGAAMWLIAGLSVLTLALILWKIWRLARMGAWGGTASARAVSLWSRGESKAALAAVSGRKNLRARLIATAMTTCLEANLGEAKAREETTRVAKAELGRARTGLRALELIATIAPLIGLLGTVLGMITAFQVLQQSGSRADPAALAGGIWEALLTTAAGMSVAIPASMALSWFESVIDRVQADMEDMASRIFIRRPGACPEPKAAG